MCFGATGREARKQRTRVRVTSTHMCTPAQFYLVPYRRSPDLRFAHTCTCREEEARGKRGRRRPGHPLLRCLVGSCVRTAAFHLLAFCMHVGRVHGRTYVRILVHFSHYSTSSTGGHVQRCPSLRSLARTRRMYIYVRGTQRGLHRLACMHVHT